MKPRGGNALPRTSRVLGSPWTEAAALSAEELARHALKPLGLPIGSDPVEALDFYLAGLARHGTEHTRTGATDAADLGADNFLSRYLKG